MRRFLQATALLALVACSDSAPDRITFGAAQPQPAALTTPSIEQQIQALYPNGLRSAAQARWSSVTKLLASNQQKPARAQFFELLDFTLRQQSKLIDPPGPQTSQDAMTQLIASMWAAVYGTAMPTPPATLAGDAVVGIVMPGSASTTTIITPAQHAAVSIPGNAVSEPTLVTIQENLTPYLAPCSGPLNTSLCQYPMFYKYDAYPVDQFQAKVKVILCPATSGSRVPSGTVDNNLRLAHQAPSDPALINGTVVGSVEVLPQLAAPGVVNCENSTYSPPVLARAPESLLRRGSRLFAAAASAIGGFLTPQSLYAVDQGAGGEVMAFSDFDWVDPNQVNLAVTGPFTAAPAAVAPGGVVVANPVTVQNVLLAPTTATTVGYYLSTDSIFSTGDVALGSASVPALSPGASATLPQDSLTVPVSTPGYYYYLLAVVDPGSALTETTRSDNVRSSALLQVLLPAGSTPLQYSPPDQSIFNFYPRTTTLTWVGVVGATGYDVETQFCGYAPFHGFTGICDTPSTPWSNYIGGSNLSTTSFTFNFVGAQTGRWRVRAMQFAGPGPWSAWWYFDYLQ